MQPLFVSQNGQLWSLVKCAENFLRSFPSRLWIGLCNIYAHSSPYPLTFKTKENTQVKTGEIKKRKKKKGGAGDFGGRVIRDSKSSKHGWRVSKNQLLIHQKPTLQQLNITYLSFRKWPFFLYTTFSPNSTHFLIFQQLILSKMQRKETHTKLQSKTSSCKIKEATFTKKVFCAIKTESNKIY